MKRIDANRYYNTYHGHSECDLESVYEELCKYNEPIVFLCGDSSLDNKYWVLDERGKALNGYDKVLDPPVARFDVCYCMNREIVYRGLKLKVINAAVEATTLSDRKRNLLPQDRFVKGKISPKDYLIVSIGGNDVVLKPSFWTVVSLLSLVYWSSIESIENGTAYGIDHFVDLFKTQVETYIGKLTQHHLPKTIFVCMIYYPCESKRSPSWADTSLSLLRYNSHPKKIQAAIQAMFRLATSKVCIQGTKVVPIALYDVLDEKHDTDYVARVEPSAGGAEKMAHTFIDKIQNF